MKVTALLSRAGAWWVIEVPEVPGVFTQAADLDEVVPQVKDAVALMLETDESDVEVEVVHTAAQTG